MEQNTNLVLEGLEHLSEEEQMRILAVMKCAEIDANMPEIPSKLTQSKTTDSVFKNSNENVSNNVSSKLIEQKDEQLKIDEKEFLTGMEDLSEAERKQILKVMKVAEAEEDLLMEERQSLQKPGMFFKFVKKC